MTTPSPSSTSTRDRILDAAQRLFAENGFSETSLRAITSEAGVNLAAVNYHFGSKEALLAEAFARLIGPVNQQRLERLDRIEAQAGDGPLRVEDVLEAYIAPALPTWKEWGGTAMRLMGRTFADSDRRVREIFRQRFGDVMRRFTAAFRRALPQVAEDDVIWRLHFAVGAMVHTMAAHEHLQAVLGRRAGEATPEQILRRLVTFISAGMRAPSRADGKR